MLSCQEANDDNLANGDNLGKYFRFLHNNCMLCVLIRIAMRRF